MLITFADVYLVVFMTKVSRAKHHGLAKSIKQVGNMWNQESIKHFFVVQAMLINAHSKFAGLFSYKQYRHSIQQDTRPYPCLLKQPFHLLLHFGLLNLT